MSAGMSAPARSSINTEPRFWGPRSHAATSSVAAPGRVSAAFGSAPASSKRRRQSGCPRPRRSMSFLNVMCVGGATQDGKKRFLAGLFGSPPAARSSARILGNPLNAARNTAVRVTWLSSTRTSSFGSAPAPSAARAPSMSSRSTAACRSRVAWLGGISLSRKVLLVLGRRRRRLAGLLHALGLALAHADEVARAVEAGVHPEERAGDQGDDARAVRDVEEVRHGSQVARGAVRGGC
mmetsp:Transcript_22660/g.67997  ORF Transcript_22660/g.67997 Transcript_22660/m.67997 type:complete len:237 (+) Transcript_22660:419-1129(+)